jgi:adenosine deaminase CECR1
MESQNPKATSISSSDYIPNTWVQIANARETFDPALGGPKGFDDWVIGALTLNPNQAYGTHNTVTKVI